MQYIESGYRGISLCFMLNWDRFLVLIALFGGFYLGGLITTLLGL